VQLLKNTGAVASVDSRAWPVQHAACTVAAPLGDTHC